MFSVAERCQSVFQRYGFCVDHCISLLFTALGCSVSPNKMPRRQEGHPAVKNSLHIVFWATKNRESSDLCEYTDKFQNRRKTLMMMNDDDDDSLRGLLLW